ncbi:MAG: response regulator transcription factor, partial [Firmicutes bacterium]|nr:response regulator transcription factor [Bacillota bacterium]
MRILAIDDERDFLLALQQLLSEQHYDVDVAQDGHTGLDMAQSGIYDLLIVDVMLPGCSGPDLLRTLRAAGDATPALLLTARDSVDDRVTGLDSGADDYLTKPFHIKELLARVRALSRRTSELVGVEAIAAGDVSLDLETRTVTVRGQYVNLTRKELQLLELLLRNRNRVMPRETLFDRIWGYDTDVDSNVLEAYVHYLRKKLDSVAADHTDSRP